MRRRLETRRRDLEARVGKGLKDQEYQRHVGRIAEIGVALESVEELMAGGMNVIEDEEQTLREQARERRAQVRRQPSH
jgi:hypothetical protein